MQPCLRAGTDIQQAKQRGDVGVKILLRLAVVLAIASPAAQFAAAGDTYYRWLDSRGNPVHSDRPPPSGTPYEVVSTGSTLKRIVTPDEGAVPKEVKPRVGNEFKQKDPAAEQEAAEKNPEYCDKAKTNLKTLDSAPRVRIRDPDTGEYRYLSDEEREAEKAKAEQAIKRYC